MGTRPVLPHSNLSLMVGVAMEAVAVMADDQPLTLYLGCQHKNERFRSIARTSLPARTVARPMKL